jgi:DNA-binding NarL/FixJ family response regulator
VTGPPHARIGVAVRGARPGGNGRAALTAREREVLRLMAVEGLSNPEMALRLHVSRTTVATHVAHILRKVGAPTRLKAVAVAYQNGWLGASSRPAVRRAHG